MLYKAGIAETVDKERNVLIPAAEKKDEDRMKGGKLL